MSEKIRGGSGVDVQTVGKEVHGIWRESKDGRDSRCVDEETGVYSAGVWEEDVCLQVRGQPVLVLLSRQPGVRCFCLPGK